MKMDYFHYFVIALLLASVFLVYYLYKPKPSSSYSVVEECVALCKQAVKNGENISAGPCLANPMKSDPNWVCDIAHWPRQPVDNDPKNQCSMYGIKAKHFVEVDTNCNVIRIN